MTCAYFWLDPQRRRDETPGVGRIIKNKKKNMMKKKKKVHVIRFFFFSSFARREKSSGEASRSCRGIISEAAARLTRNKSRPPMCELMPSGS